MVSHVTVREDFAIRTCIENQSETQFLARNLALYTEIISWILEWLQKVFKQVLGY